MVPARVLLASSPLMYPPDPGDSDIIFTNIHLYPQISRLTARLHGRHRSLLQREARVSGELLQ